MVAQALQLVAVTAAMVVQRSLGLSDASACEREFRALIFQREIERDSARGDSGVGQRGCALERVEGGAAHRAAVLLSDFEVAAAARIDVAGRALDENRDRPRAGGGRRRGFYFVHRETRPIARVEQIVFAQHDAVAWIVQDERDCSSVRAIGAEGDDFSVGRAGEIGGGLNLAVRPFQAAMGSQREGRGRGAKRRSARGFRTPE